MQRTLIHALAVPVCVALFGCSSIKAEKGPFLDDDWAEPVPGAGNVTGNGQMGDAGNQNDGARLGDGPKMGDAGCQTFNYVDYPPRAAKLTLKADVMPILVASCIACHSDVSPYRPKLGPITGMPNDAALAAVLAELRSASSQVPARSFVSPGKPEESYLMNKIDGTAGCMGFDCRTQDGCGVRMPPSLPPLDMERVSKIRDWIKQGAAAL